MGAIFNAFKSDVINAWNDTMGITVGALSGIFGMILLIFTYRPVIATTPSGMPFFTGNYEIQYHILALAISLIVVFIVIIPLPAIRSYYNSLKKRAGVE